MENVEQPSLESGSNPGSRLVVDFISGFVGLWVVLWLHAYTTVTNFFGLIRDDFIALNVSLILSVVLLILFIMVMVYFLKRKRIFVPIGAAIAFPLLYIFSDYIQEGFAIFFSFI